jgi:prolipoprotein diacylglyceryltransferase
MSCFSYVCNSHTVFHYYLYGMSSIRLSVSQLKSLNICWNNVFRKIFRYNKWESVKLVIEGLGLLNLTHLYYLSCD